MGPGSCPWGIASRLTFLNISEKKKPSPFLSQFYCPKLENSWLLVTKISWVIVNMMVLSSFMLVWRPKQLCCEWQWWRRGALIPQQGFHLSQRKTLPAATHFFC